MSGAPHSLQNLALGGSSVPHDPHDSHVAVNAPPTVARWGPLQYRVTAGRRCPSYRRAIWDEVLRLSYVVCFETRFLESSRIHSLPGSVRSYCIWSSMVEKAALSVSAFLTSSAVTKGYSPYSKKLGT